MKAMHILKLPRLTATVKVFETDDLLEIVGHCFNHGCQEWDEDEALAEWWTFVLDLYSNDPRRIETRWEDVDTHAKLFVSPFHVLWHTPYVSR
jgi:hypothetical protein